MEPTTAILITLITYKVLLVVIGLIAQRRTRDEADFFLGGRKLGPVVAALSASASSSSAWTLLGVSGAAYAWGLSAVWIFPACVGGFLVNWYVLAPALHRHSHRHGALTVTEVLAGPPGRPLRQVIQTLASVIVLVSLTSYVASQFHGAGKTFAETFDMSLTQSLLIGAAIVLFYTLLGGFWGVSLTDALQGLVMAASCAFLPVAALYQVGGPVRLFEDLQGLEIPGYMSLVESAAGPAGVGLVLGLLGIGLGYPGQPHVVNRFMALREGDAEVARGRRVAIVWAVLVYAGMLLLGWCGRVLFPAVDDQERVFIRAASELFHPLVAGVMIAAVLSAIMSTADSQLLVAASAVSHDLGVGRDGPRLLLRSRLVVFLLCVAAVVAALYGTKDIFDRVLFAWSAMGAAFGPLLLVTVLRGPVSPGRTVAAMSAGFVLSVTFYSFPATKGSIERLVPFAVALGIALTGSSKRPV